MKYVTFVDGNMMRSKDIRKEALHQVPNGRMFRKTLSVLCAQLVKISFQK